MSIIGIIDPKVKISTIEPKKTKKIRISNFFLFDYSII